ncbi:MAG: Mu-like prophage major head subunit gpT family protein [Thermoguttaceae bacterium]
MAYGGGEMRISGFGPVAVDLSGANIAGDIPLLADHTASLDTIAGQGQATIRNQQLYVEGILTDATAAGQKVLALARSGITLQASIGFQPYRREQIPPGQSVVINGKAITAGQNGLTIIRSGRLREVSLLPVGADPNTQVQIAATGGVKMKGTMKMDETITDQVNAELKAALPENQPGLTDIERVQARWGREKWHNQEGPRQRAEAAMVSAAAGRITFADFERTLLEEKARDAELALIRAERPKGPAIHSSNRDIGGTDMLQAALLCHLGAEDVSTRVFGDRVTQTARDSRMTSLVEILQAAFHVSGQEPPRNRHDLIKAAFSTASISNIVSGAQNKILLDQWARLPLTCLQLCKKVSASDFKEGKAIRLVGRNAMLDQVGAAGEIKHGYLQDSAATYRLDTYARMYAVTRQDVINDDLGALDELPRVIARGAGLKMESVFWALVLGNAGNFFGEDNGNLLTDALDLTGLGAAVAVMRTLTDADGEPVLVEPRTLVVPPALEATADALYASTNVTMAGTGEAVTTAPSASPFAGKYKPLTSPYISNSKYTGNSKTQWYLFADPNAGPAAFLAAFLDGVQNPTIEQDDTDFNTLGVQYRGCLDFGFAQCDSQGAVKSSGTGS